MNIAINFPDINPFIILEALELESCYIWIPTILEDLTNIESEFTE